MPRRGDAARGRVPDHDRFIRCLKIVEHTCWSGSASVRELAKSVGRLPVATSGTVSTVRRDVARLQSQGLPIVVDPAGICRVDAVLPGRVLERYYYSPYGELEVAFDAHFFDYDDDGDMDLGDFAQFQRLLTGVQPHVAGVVGGALANQ